MKKQKQSNVTKSVETPGPGNNTSSADTSVFNPSSDVLRTQINANN